MTRRAEDISEIGGYFDLPEIRRAEGISGQKWDRVYPLKTRLNPFRNLDVHSPRVQHFVAGVLMNYAAALVSNGLPPSESGGLTVLSRFVQVPEGYQERIWDASSTDFNDLENKINFMRKMDPESPAVLLYLDNLPFNRVGGIQTRV